MVVRVFRRLVKTPYFHHNTPRHGRFPALLLLQPHQLTSSNLSTSCCHHHESKHGSVKTGNNKRVVVGILGGGISGLSVAYYVTKLYGDKVQTVVFEESDKVGGWMRTVKGGRGGTFEMGPRTIRPFGVRGLNTLDLIEEVGLDKEVLYVERSHEVAKDRFIYVSPGLVKLPSDYSVLFKKTRPFSRPLIFAVVKDIFTRRKILSDDTIYEFVSRRFGTEIADYLTDPLIRGICAGDSKRVTVKFLMKELFELEQKHGSVVLGMLKNKIFKSKKHEKVNDDETVVGFSKIAATSILGNWAVWGLDNGGLETLPRGIYQWVKDRGGEFKFGCRVEGLDKSQRGLKVRFSRSSGGVDTVDCDHVVSSVGSFGLGRILKSSFDGVFTHRDQITPVIQDLQAIEYADLRVTGIGFDGHVLQYPGFGFLVPSREGGSSSVGGDMGGLLGVVFDTNCFPQQGNTVITAMSTVGDDVVELKDRIRKILGIEQEPREIVSRVLNKCIPQYGVGHYDRVERIIAGVDDNLISICGAWVDGVSVNDCVFRGRNVAKRLSGKINNIVRSSNVHQEEFVSSTKNRDAVA